MKAFKQIAALSLAAVLAVTCLAACANATGKASNASASATAATAEPSVSREEVEAIVDAATAVDYSTVGFSTSSETTATAMANGQKQQQSVETSMVGELDKTDATRLHMACSSQSSTTLSVTSYDMYIDNTNLMVTQGEQLYRDELTEGMADNYVQSIMSITSKEQINRLLDVASSYKITDQEGETVISITADADKLADSGLFDSSSLPEGSSVATLVASYTIDKDNHFKSARIMSSTTGTPTYRVSQTYRYYDYDAVTMPEWPDWQAYVAQMAGILTDPSGRMYLIGDDGQAYYIESIGNDGTINFDLSSLPTTTTYETYPVYTETTTEQTVEGTTTTETQSVDSNIDLPTQINADGTVTTETPVTGSDGTTTTTTTSSGGGSTSSSDKGRAYITAADGTIHYLDEPGSQIIDLGGTLVFIDANGEWYFLNVEDGEDLSEYM